MTPNEYQKAALRTAPNTITFEDALNNVALGLTGEAGEFADIIKKHNYHNHPLDRLHAVKELGDIGWYLAVAAHHLGYTLEEVFNLNIEKLKARYPGGFDPERSQHREAGDV